MEKLPKILILTLIISVLAPALNSAKTHALYIDTAGRTWWTVSELLEYKSVIDEEEKTLCANDIDCLTSYRESKLAEEEKFSALTFLQAFQLMPTELNFKTRTVKILLFDEDMSARGSAKEPRNGVIINDLVIWLEKNGFTDNLGANKIRKILNNEVADAYPVFGFIRENPIELKKDQEAEYSMLIDPEFLKEYKPSRIKYSSKANYFNRSTSTDFYSCSNAEDFPNGTCVLYVSAKDFRYTFTEIQEGSSPEEDEPDVEPIEELTPEPEPIPEDPIPEEPTPDSPQEDQIPEAPIEEPTTTSEDKNATLSILSPSTEPKAPDTGTMTNLCKEKTIEFPWWLIGLIAFGDAAVLWLFWPKNRNPKKSRS